MKKSGVWIVLGIGLVIVLYTVSYLILSKNKRFNNDVQYRYDSFDPYDINFAYNEFKNIYKNKFLLNKEKLDSNNRLFDGDKKLYIVASKQFLPSYEESTKILDFVKKGNDMFISSFEISDQFVETISDIDSTNTSTNDSLYVEEENLYPESFYYDSLYINWKFPHNKTEQFSYPGMDYFKSNSNVDLDAYQSNFVVDTTWYALNEEGIDQLIEIQPQNSKGRIFILLKPSSLTNYFLLHKSNFKHLDNIIDVLKADGKTVVWDNYYPYVTVNEDEGADRLRPGDSYFTELLKKHKELQYAIALLTLGCILFFLNQIVRNQKPVAVSPPNKNRSREFVETVSQFYWGEQTHFHIGKKIKTHFLDQLHVNYRISAKEFMLDNFERISIKTGYSVDKLKSLKGYFEILDSNPNSFTSFHLSELYSIVYTFTHIANNNGTRTRAK
ncbi:MAG: hypothetical protein ACRCVT_00985 [Leadbetterella sp.]